MTGPALRPLPRVFLRSEIVEKKKWAAAREARKENEDKKEETESVRPAECFQSTERQKKKGQKRSDMGNMIGSNQSNRKDDHNDEPFVEIDSEYNFPKVSSFSFIQKTCP